MNLPIVATVSFRGAWLSALSRLVPAVLLLLLPFTAASPGAHAATQEMITVDEYPLGTTITDSYVSRGVRFSSYEPNVHHTRADTEFPSSPVLTASEEYQASIQAEFVNPANPAELSTAVNVSFDMGPCGSSGHIGVWYADVNGNYGFFYNETIGIVHVTIPGEIRSFGITFMLPQSVTPAGEEGGSAINFGVAIDNVSFQLVRKPRDCKLSTVLDASASANSSSGALHHSQRLFSINGSGGLSEFSLSYNSLDQRNGALGPGWSHTYDISLQVHDDGAVSPLSGNAGRLYRLNGSSYVAEAGDYSALQNTGSGWLVTEPDGTSYLSDGNGTLLSVADRTGRSRILAYTNGDLVSISDSSGRSLTLAYDRTTTPHRLISVTDPANKSHDFQYQDGRLIRVIDPPAESGAERGYWEYSYNYDGAMATKRDPNGALHQYESLVSQRLTE